MKQRPDGDIEIDEKFWEEGFHIPVCEKCKGVLKPDVRSTLSDRDKSVWLCFLLCFGCIEGNFLWGQHSKGKSYSSNGSCKTERCIPRVGFILNDNVCFSPCQVCGRIISSSFEFASH